MQRIIVLTTHGPGGAYPAASYIGVFNTPEETEAARKELEKLDLPNLMLDVRVLWPLEAWVPSKKGGETE